MKKIFYLICIFLLLAACTSQNGDSSKTTSKTTTNTSDKIVTDVTKPVVTESIDFSITELKLEFPEKVNDKDYRYEYRGVFNNKLNFTLLHRPDELSVNTKQILTYDLSNGKVDVFKEFDEELRIWSFIVINENEWIYSTSKADTGTAFVRFEVIHETLNNKEILVSGLAWSDFDIPSFIALDKQIYFPVRNFVPGSDSTSGSFINQIWKYDDTGATIIFEEKGQYVNNKTSEDTMVIQGFDLNISNNAVNFVTCNDNKCMSYIYKNNTLSNIESDQQLYYQLNLDDFQLLTYENKKTKKINTIIYNEENEFIDTNFAGAFYNPTALDKNTFIGLTTEENKLVFVKVSKLGVISQEPVYIKDANVSAIRRYSDQEALLLARQKIFKFSLVENQSN